MKKLKQLGVVLSKQQMKSIGGGTYCNDGIDNGEIVTVTKCEGESGHQACGRYGCYDITDSEAFSICNGGGINMM